MNAELRISFDEIKQALFDYAEKKISASYYTIDWNAKVNPTLQADIAKLTAKDIIDLCGGVPDIIWASPDCTTYSIYDLRRVDVDLHNRGDITEITGATITYTITEKTNDEN